MLNLAMLEAPLLAVESRLLRAAVTASPPRSWNATWMHKPWRHERCWPTPGGGLWTPGLEQGAMTVRSSEHFGGQVAIELSCSRSDTA
jgi:hypothetical protein